MYADTYITNTLIGPITTNMATCKCSIEVKGQVKSILLVYPLITVTVSKGFPDHIVMGHVIMTPPLPEPTITVQWVSAWTCLKVTKHYTVG